MPKTKYHSPIKVTALKKSVKNGVRICSTKLRVKVSSCLIKSIFTLYNKKIASRKARGIKGSLRINYKLAVNQINRSRLLRQSVLQPGFHSGFCNLQLECSCFSTICNREYKNNTIRFFCNKFLAPSLFLTQPQP